MNNVMKSVSDLNKKKLAQAPLISPQQKVRLQKAIQAQSEKQFEVAELEYRALLSEQLIEPNIFIGLAFICANSGRFGEAVNLYLKALSIEPQNFNALMNLAGIYSHVRDFKNASECYRQVIAHNPNAIEAYLNLARVLTEIGALNEAKILCQKVIKLNPKLIQAQYHLGKILVLKGEHSEAERVFNSVIAYNSDYIEARYELANLLKSQGKFNEAKRHYLQIIKQRQVYTQAHFSYSTIHKYKNKQDKHLYEMLELYNKAHLQTENKIQLLFALSKAFEDIKEYEQAFHYLKLGNDLRFQKFNYRIDGDKLLIDSIVKNFSSEIFSNFKLDSEKSAKPIFVVGMPRSGTSLVEKIISSHSEVYAAGEIDYFFKLATNSFLNQSTDYLFTGLNSYTKSTFEMLGQEYLRKINLLQANSEHITDKMPLNVLMIGLIKLVLPNAKIIHCVRDPIDNCLSIFKQNFATDNYQFAYNLKTLGQYHNQYTRLMTHWHEVMPGSVYDIAYESLIENPEIEIRKLIQSCDLEWQDNCVNFYRTKGTVKTASAYQVRQPLYKSSVRLWEKYQEFLSPLITELNNPHSI